MTLPSSCNLNTPLTNEMTSAIRLHLTGKKITIIESFGICQWFYVCCVSVFVIWFDWFLSEWHNLNLQISQDSILGYMFFKKLHTSCNESLNGTPSAHLGIPRGAIDGQQTVPCRDGLRRIALVPWWYSAFGLAKSQGHLQRIWWDALPLLGITV